MTRHASSPTVFSDPPVISGAPVGGVPHALTLFPCPAPALCLSLSLSLSLCLFLSLSFSLSHSLCLFHAHTHTLSLSLSLSLILSVSFSLSHSLSLILSVSFTHTHTHSLCLSLSLSFSLSHSLCLFHAHTHTHSLSLSLSLILSVSFSLSLSTHTHTHTLCLFLSLSFSLSLSRTHTHTLSVSLSLSHSLCLILSVSLTHTTQPQLQRRSGFPFRRHGEFWKMVPRNSLPASSARRTCRSPSSRRRHRLFGFLRLVPPPPPLPGTSNIPRKTQKPPPLIQDSASPAPTKDPKTPPHVRNSAGVAQLSVSRNTDTPPLIQDSASPVLPLSASLPRRSRRGNGLRTVPVKHGGGGGYTNVTRKMLRPGSISLQMVKNFCHPLALKRDFSETEPPKILWNKKKKSHHEYHQVFNKKITEYKKPMMDGQCHLPAMMFASKNSVTLSLKNLITGADLDMLRSEVMQTGNCLLRVKCPDVVSFFRKTSGNFIARVKLCYPHHTWHWIGFDAWRGLICTGLHDNDPQCKIGLSELETNQSMNKFLKELNIQSVHCKAQFWEQGKKVEKVQR